MSKILIYFFIAIGLSMDAISVAIVYGINEKRLRKSIILPILIGTFHFIMPIIGAFIGNKINIIIPYTNKIVGLVFLILALQIYITRKDNKELKIKSILTTIFLSFSVSVDSFTVGFGFGLLKDKIIIASIIFSLTSFSISLMGLILGKKINNKFSNKTSYIGAAILLILALKYLC